MFVSKQQQVQAQSNLRRQVAMPGAPGEALAEPRDHKRKVALFVAHGMGQQVPFETMDCVAAGLMRIARKVERITDEELEVGLGEAVGFRKGSIPPAAAGESAETSDLEGALDDVHP